MPPLRLSANRRMTGTVINGASRSSTAHEYPVSAGLGWGQSTYLSHRKGSWYFCSSTLHCAAALIRSGVQKLGSSTSIGDPTPAGYE